MGLIIGGFLLFSIILVLYSCCVVSGRSSRLDEELEELARLNNEQNNGQHVVEN